MLTSLKLKSLYITPEDNVVKDFYIPCMFESIQFDRIAGFFSSKALASYSEGLEYFAKNNAKYRLIISKNISQEDYYNIEKGYKLKQDIIDGMISSLDEIISLREEKNISNFSYLLALGVIDIKIAFCVSGLFHDKSGIFYDKQGNKVAFCGSNNETNNGLRNNYEKFVVFASWINSDFYTPNIDSTINEFEKLWNNKHPSVVVLSPPDVILNKLLSFNKGQLICDEVLLRKNSIVIDYDEQFLLHLNDINCDSFRTSAFYKINLRFYINKIIRNQFYFRESLSYLKLQTIIPKIRNYCLSNNIDFYLTNRLKQFFEEKDLHIEERRKVGISIKHFDDSITSKFQEYKKIVDNELSRKLRDKQMLDSFFMATMKKSANFSVPGSGKTSAALGVYAFYNYFQLIDKIVVVGPKNSFDSWKVEFNNTFGNKKVLNYFDEHELSNVTSDKLFYELEYNSANKNLFLFNYEALGKYDNFLCKFIDKKTLLIFDEVHKVKRINGEFASHALNISKNANYVIAMTGTPIPNSYSDIYNLLHILFPNEYDDYFGFNEDELQSPNEQKYEEINNAIYPFFCRTSKSELQVPVPNNDIIINNNATDNEQKLYDILMVKYRKNKLALFIRLLQLESNPKLLLNTLNLSDFSDVFDIDEENIQNANFVDYSDDVKKLISRIDITSKKKKAVEKIKELLLNKKKLILWCIFVDSINSFYDIFKSLGFSVAKIYGGTENSERFNILNDFRNGKYDLLITNPHTLAESVSLHTVCHDAFYFEYSYNLVHLLQSKDRINRLGLQENQYTQYYFSNMYYEVDNKMKSLDLSIYDRLKEKETIMLEAIDYNTLEKVTTSEEDLDLIFNDLFKN